MCRGTDFPYEVRSKGMGEKIGMHNKVSSVHSELRVIFRGQVCVTAQGSMGFCELLHKGQQAAARVVRTHRDRTIDFDQVLLPRGVNTKGCSDTHKSTHNR